MLISCLTTRSQPILPFQRKQRNQKFKKQNLKISKCLTWLTSIPKCQIMAISCWFTIMRIQPTAIMVQKVPSPKSTWVYCQYHSTRTPRIWRPMTIWKGPTGGMMYWSTWNALVRQFHNHQSSPKLGIICGVLRVCCLYLLNFCQVNKLWIFQLPLVFSIDLIKKRKLIDLNKCFQSSFNCRL